MQKYKRYVKLQKYVNGVPTSEFKKGEFLAIVESQSQTSCEQG